LDNSRLLLAFVVSLGIIILYSQLLQWRYPNRGQNRNASPVAASPSPGAEGTPSNEAVGTTPPEMAPPESTSAEAVTSGTSAHLVKVDTDLYEAVLSSQGGRLMSFRLKKYKETDATDSPLYQMVRRGERLPMGMVVARGEQRIDDSGVDYATEAPAEIAVTPQNPAVVIFTATTKDGIKLTKTYDFSDSSYVFNIKAEAAAVSGPALTGIGLTMSQPMTALPGFRDYPTLQSEVKTKVLSENEKAVIKGVAPVSGPITYAGFGDRYFLSVFMPQKPTDGSLAMGYRGNEADAVMSFEGATQVASQVYMGPKELDLLEAANPALSKAIDFGLWGMIALPFLRALRVFYRIAPNYGVAIILLTLVVRLLVLPMSIKGQRSMMKMQRLQPQVEKIREKFKGDQERLNREMVEMYKRNHVNPMGGCLPMVIQLPVFFGLYYALLNAIELRQAPFVGWIKDLSAPDCLPIRGMPAIPFTDLHGIPVLVILMTLTALAQQWMTPRNPDPSQQKMMMYMPVVFSLIFLQLPAGLSLYYFASNLLGVVQQFILNREFKQYSPAT
jgi:YidC/Oxa1 family membrane protein insertase